MILFIEIVSWIINGVIVIGAVITIWQAITL